jgi:hypothetical protein
VAVVNLATELVDNVALGSAEKHFHMVGRYIIENYVRIRYYNL